MSSLLKQLYPRPSLAQPQEDTVDVEVTFAIEDGQNDSQAATISLSEEFASFLKNEERSETSSLDETKTATSQVVKK